MLSILVSGAGADGTLVSHEVPDPHVGPFDVLIKVVAAGVNRADIGQRVGRYPSPPGAPAGPGLECSGQVIGVGSRVTRWHVGDPVCALLGGGGYSELVSVNEGLVLAAPTTLSLADSAALPEAMCTLIASLGPYLRGSKTKTVLVHGGTSGLGSTAIQWLKALGHTVITTVGSSEKAQLAQKLGADHAIVYRESDFVAASREFTHGHGVDLILDLMGGSYLDRNVSALARGGHLQIIGRQGGSLAELNIDTMLINRLTIGAGTLRSRSIAEKRAIIRQALRTFIPHVEAGLIKPHIDTVLPFAEAMEAHRLMESGKHSGKILLTP